MSGTLWQRVFSLDDGRFNADSFINCICPDHGFRLSSLADDSLGSRVSPHCHDRLSHHSLDRLAGLLVYESRPRDIGEGVAQLKHLMSSSAPEPEKAGKYPFDHRLYHHTIVVASLAAIITGVMMMIRIDTPLFAGGNPYYLSEATVGLVFVIHGFAGVSFILLVASHIYFALRPEKHWLTWSMIRGWIGRDDYVAHFDPDKWVVTGESGGASSDTGGGALADSTVSAPREDG